MYGFLFFVLLMGVNGQSENNMTKEGTTEKTTGNETESSPASLTTTKPKESTLLNHHITSGMKSMSRSQPPDSTITATACPENSLCVNDILKPLPLIVIGALAIACFTLLVVTLVLACNMCCLKRKISSSYQICSENAQPTAQSTTRRESVNCEQSETQLMMNEISNGKPEGDEIQVEPKEPEKPEEAKEAQAAEVPNQATTEGFAQNEMPTTESPPDQDLPPPMEDIAISE